MTNNYKTLVIASIHQPNNDILMNFDSIHVLSNGGLAVYCGPPKAVNNYLLTSNITCNEYEVPIEVLLKIATNQLNDRRVKELSDQNYCHNYSKIYEIIDKIDFDKNSFKNNSKCFSLKDTFYLFVRTIHNNYLSKPGIVVIQLLLFASMYYLLYKCFNTNIGQMDGCFDLNTYLDMSCIDVEQTKSLIQQNLYFLFSSSIILVMSITSICTTTFIRDIHTFTSEHRNSKTILSDLKKLVDYQISEYNKEIIYRPSQK